MVSGVGRHAWLRGGVCGCGGGGAGMHCFPAEACVVTGGRVVEGGMRGCRGRGVRGCRGRA